VSNRTFAAGLVVCVALMFAFGGALFLLNRGHHRPEGAAEHWLAALSDTTRKGVESDARTRAAKIGDLALAKDLVHPDARAIDRKSAFDDLEVGKAVRDTPRSARVGFRVHALRPDDETKEITGVLALERQADTWRVTGVAVSDLADEGLPELPSEGGPPPSSAPWSLWVGALLGSLVIGVVTSALVRAAGRTTAAAATA
jgi:hypothetical protein